MDKITSMLPSLLRNFISTPEANYFKDITLEDKDGGHQSVSNVIMAVHSSFLFNIFTYNEDKENTKCQLPTVPELPLGLILDWMECG